MAEVDAEAYLYVKYLKVFRAAQMGMAFLELIMARVADSAKKSYKVGQVAHIQLG